MFLKKFCYFMIFATFLLFPNAILADSKKEEVTFSKCVDGDTARVIYDGNEIKIRFLAIDTPETKSPTTPVEPYGEEASNYTCNALMNASKIEIEFDSSSDKTDKYGRYLVWVYVDDSLLQSELINKGYAEVAYLYGDYKYVDTLKSQQVDAQNDKVGMWSDYEPQKNYLNYYIALGCVLLVIILCIFSKSFRKEVINDSKKSVKKKIKKEFKNIFK